jgi:hypothetical protein
MPCFVSPTPKAMPVVGFPSLREALPTERCAYGRLAPTRTRKLTFTACVALRDRASTEYGRIDITSFLANPAPLPLAYRVYTSPKSIYTSLEALTEQGFQKSSSFSII